MKDISNKASDRGTQTAATIPSKWNSRKRRKRRRAQEREALLLAREALLRHPYWCGFNKDAPGDAVYNHALAKLNAVIGDV